MIAPVQEVTGESTGNCAQMVRTSPTFVTSCRTRAAAEDLVARLQRVRRDRGGRPIGRPLRAPASADPLREATPRLIPIALLLLGLAQLGVSFLWARDGNTLGAVAGVVLAVLVMVASVWLLGK